MSPINTQILFQPNCPKKILLGCRAKILKGYKNIDIENHPGVDIVTDFRTLTFHDLDEVRSHHLLEHFSREESFNVIRLWKSWLKVGGHLIIETPDFEGICQNFNKDKYWMARHSEGSQEAEWAFHRSCWWQEKFEKILSELGFEILEIRKSVSRKILPNITVIAKKL